MVHLDGTGQKGTTMRLEKGSRLGRILRSSAAALAVLAGSAAFAQAAQAHDKAAPAHKKHAHRHSQAGIGYLPLGSSERGEGYRELSGDADSGVGFYPLPYRYRVGAWRHHMRQAAVPPFIRNGVLYAMTMDQYRYNYWWATPPESYRFGVYDPFEGVGSPYSAGFYGPAPGDEDEPAFPFGRPYPDR